MELFDKVDGGLVLVAATAATIYVITQFFTATDEYIEQQLSKVEYKECVSVKLQHWLTSNDTRPLKRFDVRNMVQRCDDEFIKSKQLEALDK